ncbi:hypothetical protein M9Y10_033742 [Tritrichomonas musculus]|uniref:Uncharacterized protein n=1 Tax=Tritrichomonas musculus TaxID=1915356 RepID=A0ABR2KCZ8_9EUKA
MTEQRLPIHIDKQTVQNPKYFVYKNKKYQVNFDLLKQNCTYFYKNQAKYLEKDDINIFDDDEEEFPLEEDSINSFIKICHNEYTDISILSVIHLQYLSYKYEYPALKEITNEYITKYPQELIFKRFSFKKKKSDIYTKYEEEFFDTTREEEYISKHLNDFIKRDELPGLEMSVLLRILEKYLKDEESEIKVNNKDMIDFLFRCIDEHGIAASVLFNKIDFGEEQINVIHRLQLYQSQDKFDFNFLNSTLANTALQLIKETDRQKEEYSESFDKMKTKFEEQSEELKRVKEEYEKEIDRIKKDVELRMINIENNYEQMCNKQKNMIENNVILKFHEIIIKLMGDDNFYRLDTESQIFVVDEIINQNKYHNNYEKENKLESMVQKILFFNQLFQNTSIYESNKSSHELVKFIIENAKILKLSNDICVNLYQKNLLEKSLLVICNSFNEFEIYIEYPAESYEEISTIINDLLKQNKNPSQQIQISVNDKQNDTFEKKFEITQTNLSPIEYNSFEGRSSLTKVVIPTSVTTIESNSFKGCSSLSEITIPTSVTKICESSFEGCSSLTKVVIPTSVTTIESNSFKGCSSLSEIIIPISITQICESSFEGCSSLTRIVIPTSVTTIESNSFKGCSSLNEISIPISVSKICESSFEGCSSLTKMDIPPSVTTIESNSFKNCSSLNEISIPTSVSKICESSFERCSSLKQIIIPSGVNNLGQDAFRGCSSLSKITFPENIESIGKTCFYECNPKVEIFGKIIPKNAFLECSTLQEIIISSDTTIIDQDAFRGCSSLTKVTIPDSVTIIKNNAFQECSKLPEIVIPSSITSIGDSAFLSCSSLKQITIPSSVNNLGQNVFRGCSSLTKVTIPNSVTIIKNNAFQECSNLPEIIIPSSVNNLGQDAFRGCSSLSKITFPENIESIGKTCFYECNPKVEIYGKIIPKNAFLECSTLQEIIISSDTTIIGQDAFRGCSSLSKITFPENIESIGKTCFYECNPKVEIFGKIIPKNAFLECSTLQEIIISSDTTIIDQDAFRGCSSLSKITFPENIESIGKTCFYECNPKVEIFGKIIPKNAFLECSTLQEIIISSDTTIIGQDAFRGCSSLTKVTIPDSVTIIKNNAFQECSKLPEIVIPSSITSIGDSAFLSCSSLKQITIPSSVNNLGQNVFRGCSSLTKVTIPNSVTIIKNNAFQECSKLPEIVIPSSITSIGDSAFLSCSSLKRIIIPPSVTSIGDNSFSNCKEISTDFKYTGSLQTYRIPVKGVYQIKAVGASGSGGNVYNTSYRSVGGKGAQIIGKFTLDKGDIIDIVVGGRGRMTNANDKDGASGGGGGGTFIFKRIKSITDNKYQFTKNQILYETLLVAAGGSGAEDTAYREHDSTGFDGEASNFKSPNNFTEYSTENCDPNSSSSGKILGITQFIKYDAKGCCFTRSNGYSYGGYGCGGSADDSYSCGGGWCRGSNNYQTTSWSLDVKAVGTNGANDGDGYAFIHIC